MMKIHILILYSLASLATVTWGHFYVNNYSDSGCQTLLGNVIVDPQAS